MKNKITDLHNHLFATLEALQDPDTPMEIDRAKAVAEVAKVVVEVAKVEVAFLETTGQVRGSTFFPEERTEGRPELAQGNAPRRLRAS